MNQISRAQCRANNGTVACAVRRKCEGENVSAAALGMVQSRAAGARVGNGWEEETGAAAVDGDSGKDFAAQHFG